MLVVSELVKEFPTPGEPLRVLDEVSLTLAPGQQLAIVGPSGSGKSTLLHIVGTLDTPTRGRVEINSVDPHALDEPRLAAFRNQHVGFVFQEHHLLPQLTALENVISPALAKGRVDDAARDRARQLLEQVGLAKRLDHRPAQLSGGECQRVAVARALVMQPSLVLADEPTGNLDQATADTVGRLLIELQRDHNLMLLTVTHSPALAAMFERQVRLENGRLVS